MNKKGISLVVLVIVIVLMIVFTAAIMSNISKKDLTKGANEATIKNNFKVFQEELDVFVSKHLLSSKGKFKKSTLNADLNSISFNTKSSEKNIFDVIPSLEISEYTDNVTIVDGVLSLDGLDEQTNKWAVESIKAGTTSYGKVNVNVIVTRNKSTINGYSAAYNNPIIPVGFKAINTTDASWSDVNNDGSPDGWNDGLVISDSKGNEFVWVPVDGLNVKYEKWTTNGIKYDNASLLDVPDELPDDVSEGTQITKYGGFYIGRYEAGVPANQTVITGGSAEASNVVGVPQVKKGATPWAFIDYNNSNASAKNLYNTAYVKSGLMTGTMWDTTCKWFSNSGKDVDDSRTYGDHKNSESPANVSGAGLRQVTGRSEYWKVKNIYDLAGNVWEWTIERYISNRVRRGGSYGYNGSTYSLSRRDSLAVSGSNYDAGFRVALYIL